MHPYVWQSGRKIASSRVAPQDEFISLSQQQMYKAAGTGCFAHSNEPCTYKSKDSRVELARKRKDFDLYVYGERRDSEQPKAANLSAWRIATVKKSARTNQKTGAPSLLESDITNQFLSRKKPVSALRRINERKEYYHGRQEDSLQDLSQRRRDA